MIYAILDRCRCLSDVTFEAACHSQVSTCVSAMHDTPPTRAASRSSTVECLSICFFPLKKSAEKPFAVRRLGSAGVRPRDSDFLFKAGRPRVGWVHSIEADRMPTPANIVKDMLSASVRCIFSVVVLGDYATGAFTFVFVSTKMHDSMISPRSLGRKGQKAKGKSAESTVPRLSTTHSALGTLHSDWQLISSGLLTPLS